MPDSRGNHVERGLAGLTNKQVVFYRRLTVDLRTRVDNDPGNGEVVVG